MNDEIKLRTNKNLLNYRKLREAVEKVIADHNHFLYGPLALEKLCDIARQMQDKNVRRNEQGLTDEKEAFYEILLRQPQGRAGLRADQKSGQVLLQAVQKLQDCKLPPDLSTTIFTNYCPSEAVL